MSGAIAIFGGTFDPVHVGHLIIAEVAAEELGCERVLFVPSCEPPHKQSVHADPVHRLSMLRAAVEFHPGFEVSTVELDRGGISYTVDTVTHFKSELPKETELFLLVGADSLLDVGTWRDPERILANATLAVVKRPGFDLTRVDPRLKARVRMVDAPLVGVSSTEIRHRIAAGKAFRCMVPESTYRYILREKLYVHSPHSAPGSP